MSTDVKITDSQGNTMFEGTGKEFTEAANKLKARDSNIGHNSADVKALAKRANHIEDELDSLKEEKKDLYTEIKASGISTKEFRAAIKFARKPPEKSFKELVNANLSAMGQMTLFQES